MGSGALIPLELCIVPPGQIMRKQVPPEKTKSVLDFATKKPADRLRSITSGLEVRGATSAWIFSLHPLIFHRSLRTGSLSMFDTSGCMSTHLDRFGSKREF